MTASKGKQNKLAAIAARRDEARTRACEAFGIAASATDPRQGLMAASSCRHNVELLSREQRTYVTTDTRKDSYVAPADLLELIGQKGDVLADIEKRHHLASLPDVMKRLREDRDTFSTQCTMREFNEHVKGAGLEEAPESDLVAAGIDVALVAERRQHVRLNA